MTMYPATAFAISLTAFNEMAIIHKAGLESAGRKTCMAVDVIAALPRNASGKILRKDLRAPYWEGRERQVN